MTKTIAEEARDWVKAHGVKGDYQMSLDVCQEVAFEAGARLALERAAQIADKAYDGDNVEKRIRALAGED